LYTLLDLGKAYTLGTQQFVTPKNANFLTCFLEK